MQIAREWVTQHDHAPTVAEFLSAVQARTARLVYCREQWTCVLRAIEKYGPSFTPGVPNIEAAARRQTEKSGFRWKNHLTARIVASMGWAEICANPRSAAVEFERMFLQT